MLRTGGVHPAPVVAEIRLDAIDAAIIDVLRVDARISYAALAHRLNIGAELAAHRMRCLQADRTILGYSAIVPNDAPDEAGLTILSRVCLDDAEAFAPRKFVDTVMELDEVIACHAVASHFDFLLKVCVHDMPSYRRLIERLPFVNEIRTLTVIHAVKVRQVD